MYVYVRKYYLCTEKTIGINKHSVYSLNILLSITCIFYSKKTELIINNHYILLKVIRNGRNMSRHVKPPFYQLTSFYLCSFTAQCY